MLLPLRLVAAEAHGMGDDTDQFEPEGLPAKLSKPEGVHTGSSLTQTVQTRQTPVNLIFVLEI